MLNPFAKTKARKAYLKAQQALQSAKSRGDTRSIHTASQAVREAMNARLRVGA